MMSVAEKSIPRGISRTIWRTLQLDRRRVEKLATVMHSPIDCHNRLGTALWSE
jgi:hypothetical protein